MYNRQSIYSRDTHLPFESEINIYTQHVEHIQQWYRYSPALRVSQSESASSIAVVRIRSMDLKDKKVLAKFASKLFLCNTFIKLILCFFPLKMKYGSFQDCIVTVCVLSGHRRRINTKEKQRSSLLLWEPNSLNSLPCQLF